MSDDIAEEVTKIRRARRGQSFLNTTMMVAIGALSVAVVMLFVQNEDTKDNAVSVINQAEQSLKSTCPLVDTAQLPKTAQDDCAAAERNELTERVAEVIDEPDPNDPEFQDREIQDPEIQDPESQDPEAPDTEENDPDAVDDPDPDDPEINDPDPDDPEIQDEEIQDPEEQNAPVCPDGYAQSPFHYFGPDGADNTGDEEDWILCKKVG